MPNTKLRKDTLKNHFHYAKWAYIVIALGVFFVADFLFTTTEYRPPAERKVEIEIVASYVGTDPLQAICDEILLDKANIDDTLEQVSVYNIAYSGDPNTDYNGAQLFVVRVSAQEGDIYMLPRDIMQQYQQMGAFLPLDGLIEQGLLNVDGMDLSQVTLDEPVEEGAQPSGKHVYALPASRMNRMKQPDIGYDNTDAYLVIMQHCVNPETSAKVMQRFMDALSAP